MFRNYFKIAWRNILKNKGFAFINITGLAIGLTACVLILMYVIDENSYDRHHKDGERTYRIISQVKGDKFVGSSAPTAMGLKNDFPEVEEVTRLLRFPGNEKMLLKNPATQNAFYETNCYYIDSTFFDLFSYEFKYGDIRTALNAPNVIILQEEVAEKLFGPIDPVGKEINVGLSFGAFDYTIKGVIKTTSAKSHIPAHVFLSMNNGDIGDWAKNQTNWASNNLFVTYYKLKANTDHHTFERKLPAFVDRNMGEDMKAMGFTKTLIVQPMKDIYLHSNYAFEIAPNGNIKYLYVFSSIALFILILACINFMNLSTARSEKRAAEVGMRKVVGAYKSDLIAQFLSESVILSCVSMFLTLILIILVTPLFNHWTKKNLSVLDDPRLVAVIIGLALITGVLAGLYPAVYLASFKPIAVLKGKIKNNFSVVAIRKGLIVFQFFISTVLIFSAILINGQMRYLSNYSLGFDKSQKLILPLQTQESDRSYQSLRVAIESNPVVQSIGRGAAYPGIEQLQDMLFYGEGKTIEDNVDIQMVNVDEGYFKTLGFTLLYGRAFSKEFSNDTLGLVLNETAVKNLGYTPETAVGKKATYDFHNEIVEMNILGVMKDYNYQSLHTTIKPIGLTISPFFGSPSSYMIVNINTRDFSKLISQVKTIWSGINPNSPFEYSFLDQDFQKNYEKETKSGQVVKAFTVIGIFVACLGLFGLAAFSTEQKVKEIGVRKVLGAGVPGLVGMLSKDFLKLVGISIFIALPVGYMLMRQWLMSFAYQVSMDWWMFFLAGLTSLFIAFATVSFQTIKAAVANPIKSLRTE